MNIQARLVAKYVLEQCKKKKKPISNLQLQKMLYYIQIELMKQNEDIIIDEFQAWRFGPVINNVYYDYCVNGPYAIMDIYDIPGELPKKVKEVINKVIREKINLNPWEMVEQTHRKGGAWFIIYNNGKGNKNIIPKELIREKELQV